MGKNLTGKLIFITVLVVVAAWTLYPPSKTLKPGIDLAGGTSLIYEIDTQGLAELEKENLAHDMITVLRRRIDPANIQNLVWRPMGSTRFEIQMPLASAEARQKRQDFETVMTDLPAENISIAAVMRALAKPPQQRREYFAELAGDSPQRREILDALADAHDQRNSLREQRDALAAEISEKESSIASAGIDLERVQGNIGRWITLEKQQLADALKEFDRGGENQALLTDYVRVYADWGRIMGELTDPQTGRNVLYEEAKNRLDGLNLSIDRMNIILEMDPESSRRRLAVEELKSAFPRQAGKIDAVLEAFDRYRPFRGRLDDPKDVQRMLKGAGVLEFRILPTIGHSDVDEEEMAAYARSLGSKGPKGASDSKFVWCEIEDIKTWNVSEAVIGSFGDKYYVLASNGSDEAMLHASEADSWKLQSADPTTDQMGRRAIGFVLDERGGRKFYKLTGKNIGRPLCILLDNIAISAPNLRDQIRTHGIIEGSFTQTEVEDMVNKLNAGSLPARLVEQPISVKTIGPSIGADNRDRGIKAGLIGFGCTALCMLVYYLVCGSIADAALVMNLLFVLAMMALLRATFTLPGIAGIILTIGMSVDANVLIFERIREEQQRGSSLRIAVRNGYQRAFRAIFDANLTTFITAAILYWRASEEVKGFAIVLMLGIISSMFTALFVTRVILDFLIARGVIRQRLLMLRLIGQPRINWMAARLLFVGVSGVLVAAGIYIFMAGNKNDRNYDIEFTGGTSVEVNFKDNVSVSRQQVEDAIHDTAGTIGEPALAAATVYSIGTEGDRFEINTTATGRVVEEAILSAFGDDLQIQRNLEPNIVSREKVTPDIADTHPELADFSGGAMIRCELSKAVTARRIDRRLKELVFKPQARHITWYAYRILDDRLAVPDPNESMKSFVYLSAPPEASLRRLSDDEWTAFVQNETEKVTAAMTTESSLPRVTQFSPSIGAEAKTRALIAVVLSLFAIVAYIWVRFGDLRYGLAAIIALVHDVAITLGAVAVCKYVADTPIGRSLLIGDFKINLAIIAALLTIIGYSLNDTIVVFDRIRENRHKGRITPAIITDSINQTLSRTLMTSFTTFIVVLVMYVFGGAGLRGFTFAIGFGIIVGTYSSIAIAAPILLLRASSSDRK
jgi:SecD/SecF fusion protein